MAETLTALVFAHLLADFVGRDLLPHPAPHPMSPLLTPALYGALGLICLIAAMGTLHWGLLWLTVMHLLTDLAKARLPHRLWAFLAVRALHLTAATALALWLPGLWAQGWWAEGLGANSLGAGHAQICGYMALAAGAIWAIRAGGIAVGLLMAPFADASPDGLPGGGRVIGLLERGLVFALVLLGQPEGVGLLIAAKSILRFGAVKDDRAASEYVIIGTLASVGWALLAAYGTQIWLTTLPPLGIGGVTP